MKFRILVKQLPEGSLPGYYPQFRQYGLWWYYDAPSCDTTVIKRVFLFRADAERFLNERFKAWQERTRKSVIIPWNPYQ